jgi:hypothetical protein
MTEASFHRIEVNDNSVLEEGLVFARYQAVVRGQVLPARENPSHAKLPESQQASSSRRDFLIDSA